MSLLRSKLVSASFEYLNSNKKNSYYIHVKGLLDVRDERSHHSAV